MALKDILDTFKKPTSQQEVGILPQLERYFLKLNGQRLMGKPENRAKDCFHPSEISTNKCTRSLVYSWLKVEPTNDNGVNGKGRRIFDTGHHYGYILQQYFWDMGILEGMYHCVECECNWWDVSPRNCPQCDAELEIWYNLRYDEVPIHNKKWNIIGHSDGILNRKGKRTLIELKSIKNRDLRTPDTTTTFEDLNQAKLEHVYQANLYMDAIDQTYDFSIDEGLIIYFAKNTQDLKEFPIRKMDMMLTPSYNKINEVNHALANRYLPERAGRIKSDPICRYCPFKDLCWSGEHTFEEVDNRGALS